MVALGRDARVQKYLVHRLASSRPLGRFVLAKLIYLADCEARRLLGRPLTGFTYKLDKFGPYDEARFRRALDGLKSMGLVVERDVPKENRDGGKGHEISDCIEIPCEFGLAEKKILDLIVETWGTASEDELRAAAYQTEPCARAKRDALLDMDILDNTERALLGGLDLETVLASEVFFERNEGRELADVWKEATRSSL